MARVMTPEQFKDCPKGTVFSFGEPWAFSRLLVLEEHIKGDGYWGFWALDPMWVESESSGEDWSRLDEMLTNGVSYPSEQSVSKYMSYDGRKMEVFFVLERADIETLIQTIQQ
ncbi:MAG: hypothetical protein ACRCU5_13910 [Rhizobiaceae bacterium]